MYRFIFSKQNSNNRRITNHAKRRSENLLLSILVSISFAFVVYKQKDAYKEKEIIAWSETNKLTWDSFKGKVPESKYGAITCSTIYSKFEKGKILTLNIRACFIKKESWHKIKYSNDYLLNHEQKHFDITEIYARKLRKILTDTSFKNETVARKEISKIIRNNNKELNAFQDLYDKETNHSINIEKQTEWDKNIERELKLLNAYQNNLIEIKSK